MDYNHRETEKEIVEVLIGTDVDVYFNLHKKVFSVRDRKSKKVVAHLKEIRLKDAVFKVSEKGRQRVLKEKRKNVHAYIRGIVVPYRHKEELNKGYYDPYKTETFINKDTGEPLMEASSVTLLHKSIYYNN